MKKINARELHRDLGYFYLGLIITFAFSGILMNHRDSFHADKYTVESKAIEVKMAENEKVSEEKALNYNVSEIADKISDYLKNNK